MLQAVLSNPVVAFIIVAGLVIFIHELGHFLAGVAMGIKVEEFSIGFGPRAVGFRRNGVDYKVCWLPLGGYVRFYGMEPGAKPEPGMREKSMRTAALYKRAIVVMAGPAANFLLSFVVASLISLYGKPVLAPVVAPIPGYPAAEAGLQAGDKITAVNARKVATWEEFTSEISDKPGQRVTIDFVRGGEPQQLSAKILSRKGPSGDERGFFGVTPVSQPPRLLVPEEGILASLGFEHADLVTKINGKEVNYFYEAKRGFLDALTSVSGAETHFTVEREGQEKVVSVSQKEIMHAPGFSVGGYLDAFSPLAATLKVKPDASRPGAFAACQLQTGDTILSAGGQTWPQNPSLLVQNLVQGGAPTSGGKVKRGPLRVIDLEGKVRQVNCTLPAFKDRAAFSAHFPFTFHFKGANPVTHSIKADTVGDAIAQGGQWTVDMMQAVGKAVTELLTGKRGINDLGGPVAIAQHASQAASMGFIQLIWFMAYISISIGAMNLLPIPMLDGGKLLFYLAEGAYGKELPAKFEETLTIVGVVFILGLSLLVLYKDVLGLF